MKYDFILPELGEGVNEGELARWLVSVGSGVEEDQPLLEVMTDKATMEVASPVKGVLRQTLVKEGQLVQVGALIAQFDVAEGTEVPLKETESTSSGQPMTSMKTSSDPITSTDDVEPSIPPVPTTAESVVKQGSVLASPATRHLARDNQIDIKHVVGSGPQGRILREDVEKLLNTPASRLDSSPVMSGREQRIPIRGIRKVIAQRMIQSKHTAAHFTHVDEFEASKLIEARQALSEKAKAAGEKLTFLPFVVKAVSKALREFPRLNASVDELANEIVIKHDINLGIAVATPTGDLIVPVIPGADQKSVFEIASAIRQLADKAREGKLSPAELKNGTFTITSMGVFGGLMSTPIINYPEIGILGFHKVRQVPVVKDGRIVLGNVANLSVSLDHRVVDGYMGAQFLSTCLQYLEEPYLLLV